MLEVNRPDIETVELTEDKSYGKFVVEPLQRGYGLTLGNSLRRVLLSSLQGSAITALRVENVFHEFSTVDGVIEDMTEIILNVKSIRTKMHVDGPKTVYLNKPEGYVGEVKAGDIATDDEVEIRNPEQVICRMNGQSRLFMEFTISNGVGYNTAEQNKWPNQPIGVITIDSIFTPIKRVNFAVENSRVGQVTDFDKLTMEILTDRTIAADTALSSAAAILTDHLQTFIGLSEKISADRAMVNEIEEESDQLLDTPIEDLDFSVRTYNCLKRANINSIGDLIVRSIEDMMRVRNLGRKSLEEVIIKLEELGLSLAESKDV